MFAKRAYQIHLQSYPLFGFEKHPHRFCVAWFNMFQWLEYSVAKDATYCFPCYLIGKFLSGHPWADVFTIKRFYGWNKVNDGRIVHFLIMLKMIVVHYIIMQ